MSLAWPGVAGAGPGWQVGGMATRLVHLVADATEHQAAEVRRLLDLGAAPADIGQGEVPWVVLADPEGNEFCVLTPR